MEMPASPIRKLAPLADAAKQRGIHVFHLNIGQPDLPTPQVAIDAIRNIDRKVLEYSPSAGYRSYREKLVGYYDKYNIKLTADDIIITSGGSEAVLFSFMACLNPGDEIIVPEPAYANYMAFAISAGARIRTIATTIEEGFSLPKVEKFEELINERTRARRGRPRLLHPPSRAAQPSSSPAAPDAARPPCGKTCVFWYCSHVDAPLRPKRALLPGESPGRQNRQGRCAVGSGPIRARTRIAGQKTRAREHGEGNVRRAEAANPWPETAGTRT